MALAKDFCASHMDEASHRPSLAKLGQPPRRGRALCRPHRCPSLFSKRHGGDHQDMVPSSGCTPFTPTALWAWAYGTCLSRRSRNVSAQASIKRCFGFYLLRLTLAGCPLARTPIACSVAPGVQTNGAPGMLIRMLAILIASKTISLSVRTPNMY